MTKSPLHEAAYQFMEIYRQAHPGFYYCLRERDNKNKETGISKLDDGCWFQGNRNYAFVGLYDRSGGTNKTKSFGIVFQEAEEGLTGYIEIVHNGESEKPILDFYQKVIDLVGGFDQKGNTKYQKYFEGDNYLESLENFLTNLKPKIDQLVKDLGLEGFFISKEKFERTHAKIKSRMSQVVRVEGEKEEPNEEDTSLSNTILYGPPGTGKTYNTINKALEIINEKEEQSLDWNDRVAVKKLFNQRIEEERIVFTTFHQSMSYEDFVEGIKPQEPKEEGQAINYIVEDGIFKGLSRAADSRKGNFLEVLENFKTEIFEGDNKTPLTIKASGSTFDVIYKGGTVFNVSPHNSTKKDPSYPVSISNIEKYFNTNSTDGIYNPTYVRGILEFLFSDRDLRKGRNIENIKKNYVLIIDEINRGNVSQIFGELITLIEEDKRLGKGEELQVTLPYSKERFGVPSNLYILGTMNTADRSVEALDAALRRRFSFEEMPPRPELIAKKGKAENGVVEEINLEEVLTMINLRIEKLLDKDHLIGHSYFMSVIDLDGLKSAFQNKIIPLLQEYFFGDYGKIGLVLGEGFFEEEEKENVNLFATFREYEADDFATRAIYKFKNFTENPTTNNEQFIKAINTLLGK